MTRKQAILNRLDHYFTGKPCKYGHICERRTTNGDCLECMASRYKEWSQSNADFLANKFKDWRKTNHDRMRENNIAWNAANRNRRSDLWLMWRLKNPEKAKGYILKRAKRIQQATPKWIKWKALEQIYTDCPKGFHVDHIVPLDGYYWLGTIKVKVSGLNVPWNLQYLAPNENWQKQNQLSKRDLKIAQSLKPNRKGKANA